MEFQEGKKTKFFHKNTHGVLSGGHKKGGENTVPWGRLFGEKGAGSPGNSRVPYQG